MSVLPNPANQEVYAQRYSDYQTLIGCVEKLYRQDNVRRGCPLCKTKKGTLNAHHIIYRSNGGADTLDNLITLCAYCHKNLHSGKLKDFESKLEGKRKGQLKHATQMNSIRVQLLKHYLKMVIMMNQQLIKI